MSVTFIIVFALLVPFLLGLPAALTVSAVIGLFVVVQVGFLVAVNSVAPSDPVWYLSGDTEYSPTGRLSTLVVVALVLTGVLAALELTVLSGLLAELPLVVLVAVPLTPLLLPGLYMRRRETEVKERDDEFPSFIRALGSVESVKQTSTANVLSTLRKKNFGALTETIDALYKRLRMRIDSRRSWRLFAAESGSNLIQKFGDMYVVGRRMGGEPRQLGSLISDNMNQVLRVREQRSQTTRTLIGVIYGITFATVFAFYVGVEIVELLVEITDEIDLEQNAVSFILNPAVYDIPTLRVLIGELVILNALLSALLIRLADRGHFVTSLLHLVLLVWMSGITAYVTEILVGSLISV
jgi:flagellar protein FlaJ